MSDLYSAVRVEAAKAQFNWLTDDFKLAFIDADEYTVNYATDQVLEDIPTAAVIAISESLDTKSVSASGWMKAGTTVFVEPEGSIGEAVVLCQGHRRPGDVDTSRLPRLRGIPADHPQRRRRVRALARRRHHPILGARMALPENWVDLSGQKVNAAFLNQLGEEFNALQTALGGKSLRVLTQTAFDALSSKDTNTVYVVIP
ncbi:hypothetical protein SEA_MRYOLO_32 [Mycobacterium phage Mryolo]|nr:hypothetical protein SEA_MRYOLO_32 [Mycobacterium phage Mryolo]